jgi:CBS domain-containing protein
MFVSEYMTPEPLVVSTTEGIDHIAELIRVHKIRQVPVVDEANRLVGIVTDRDIRSATGYDADNPLALVAEEIMSPDVVTITPGADLHEAAELLHEHSFGALPVVVGDHVIGIISTRDLLRYLMELMNENAAHESQHYEPAYPF